MDDFQQKWDLIIKVHNYSKVLILWAEELDLEHEFFWPPVIQQRDALDHIIRAQRGHLFPDQLPEPKRENPQKYVLIQLDKTLGHAYRAFFDVADWFSIILRERIKDILSEYSRQTVISVMPDYATKVESRVDAICDEIAAVRNDKDVANSAVTEGMETYKNVIDELVLLFKKLQDARDQFDKVEYSRT